MKNIALLVSVIFFSFVSLCGCSQNGKIFQSDKLEKIWETPQVLKVPESVCYDSVDQVLYVSSINGKSMDKDGNGFISKLSLNGKVLVLHWASGLNAPKGMGVYNGVLYVADIDRVAAIDTKDGSVINYFEAPGARFLNDIAIDKSGTVYISDTQTNRIYKLSDGKCEIWLDDPLLTNPNGLYVDGDDLLIGCKKIVRAGLEDKKMSVWLDNTGSIDGLEAVGDGRYLFSDWSGNVYLVTKDRKTEKILSTAKAGINAADIMYLPSKKILFVPTFLDNRVMAYELK